jgi:endo-1,4-beta-xylanase
LEKASSFVYATGCIKSKDILFCGISTNLIIILKTLSKFRTFYYRVSYFAIPILFLIIGSVTKGCQVPLKKKSEKLPKSLKSEFKEDFLIGAALGAVQINQNHTEEASLLSREFNVLTPENCMKWERIHPAPDSFNYVLADKLIQMANGNNQQIVGHTLIWHNQIPDWVFTDNQGYMVDSSTLYTRMNEHIDAVAGRYSGQLLGWDVLNEAINDDGSFRQSKFYNICGEAYIYKAFEMAAMADSNAELYYNDYSMHQQPKVEAAVALAKKIRKKGLKIDGIGMQGHWGLSGPPVDLIEQSILKIHAAGLKVMITELDIDVLPNPKEISGAEISDSFEADVRANPYSKGLPDSVNLKHAKRYQDLFKLFYKHRDKISRVTFWGVHDGQSWKNDWPAKGRTNYCLVFDREFQPKLAYEYLMEIKNTTKE